MAGKKGMRAYSREVKVETVRLFFYEEGKTRAEITELLGIRDPGRVKKWLHQYRQEKEKWLFIRRAGRDLLAGRLKKRTRMLT